MRGRVWWIVGGVAALLVVGGVVWALLPGGGSGAPQVRARQYTDAKACLLTDAQGLAGRQAQPVWSAMEDASQATHAKVMYLAVSGPPTVANAIPYVNTLVERHCDVVVGIGAAQNGAMAQVARTTPGKRFVVVGSGAGRLGRNVTRVAGDGVRDQLAHVLETALRH